MAKYTKQGVKCIVFIPKDNTYISNRTAPTPFRSDARRFFSEKVAERYAEKNNGMIFYDS